MAKLKPEHLLGHYESKKHAEIKLCALGSKLKQTQIGFLHLAHSVQAGSVQANPQSSLKRLHITARKDTTHHMRDGEVVLYLRPGSRVWQVRYQLFDRK